MPRNGLLLLGADSPDAAALVPTAVSPVETFGLDRWRDVAGARRSSTRRAHALRRSPRRRAVRTIRVAAARRAQRAQRARGDCRRRSCRHSAPRTLADGLRQFKGIKRRLETVGVASGVTVLDDFAHHPTAVSRDAVGAAHRLSRPADLGRVRAALGLVVPAGLSGRFRRARSARADEVVSGGRVPLDRCPKRSDSSPSSWWTTCRRQGRHARHIPDGRRHHRDHRPRASRRRRRRADVERRVRRHSRQTAAGASASNACAFREAGDSALLLELDDRSSTSAVNARAIAIAAAVRRAGLAGVRDVVSTYRSVAVYFDPLAIDVDAIRDTLHASGRYAADACRGQDRGHPGAIRRRHAGRTCALLRRLPASALRRSSRGTRERGIACSCSDFCRGSPTWARWTRRSPCRGARRRACGCLAGSVGIAGAQTGVYPRDSPGGWQLIGRTPVSLFDPTRVPAALVAPGDTVRFVRDKISAPVVSGFSRTTEGPGKAGHCARSITVLRPGLFTTIQDTGRWGHQASGVPVSGPMDRLSHRLANALVGNEPTAALLEATLAGPEIESRTVTLIAVTGADLGATLDGARRTACIVRQMPARRCAALRRAPLRGACIRRLRRRYHVPPVLGSRATHTYCGLGGLDGRAIAAGDRLPLGDERSVGPWRVIRTAARNVTGGGRRARDSRSAARLLSAGGVRAATAHALHRHVAVRSHGIPATGGHYSASRGPRDDL